MNKPVVNKSIAKEAFARTKMTFGRKSLFLAIIFIVMLGSLALKYVSPLSTFITVPFLIVPCLFAFMSVNTMFTAPIDKDKTGFMIMFRAYFSDRFFGVFKIIKSFLKALLVMIIIIIIGSIIASSVMINSSPEFLNNLLSISEISDPVLMEEEMRNLIFGNTEFMNIILISTYVSLITYYLVFAHGIMVEGFKSYFNLFNKAPMHVKDLNQVHKITFKQIKKSFYKDYYKAIWFIPLLIVVGYFGGIALGYVFNLPMDLFDIIGLFGALILSFIFIPYYFDVTYFLYQKYCKDYVSSLISVSISTLEELKKNKIINEEKEKELTDFLNKSKEEKDK